MQLVAQVYLITRTASFWQLHLVSQEGGTFLKLAVTCTYCVHFNFKTHFPPSNYQKVPLSELSGRKPPPQVIRPLRWGEGRGGVWSWFSHHTGLSVCVWCLLTGPPFALSPALTNRTHGCLTSDCPPGFGPCRLRAEVSPLLSWQLRQSPQQQAYEQGHERAVPGGGWGQPPWTRRGEGPLTSSSRMECGFPLPNWNLGTCELEKNFDSQVRKPKSTAQVKELNLASWLLIYVLFTVVNCLKLSFLVS